MEVLSVIFLTRFECVLTAQLYVLGWGDGGEGRVVLNHPSAIGMLIDVTIAPPLLFSPGIHRGCTRLRCFMFSINPFPHIPKRSPTVMTTHS